MYCYLWWEKSEPNECKFGERWVFAGQDPETEIRKRIKSSLGVRKDKYNDGTIVLETFWDVTEYAKKYNRYYKQSRVDDHIRPHIGFRKGSTGEVHELPADEVKLKVDKLLSKVGQPLPVAGVSAWQARSAEQVIQATESDKTTILAELCARFGKTIWSGVLIRERNPQLTVIASYVLTSFNSFLKDLSGFEQFKDLVIVDTVDPDYRETISTALSNGKQVVAFLSLCVGSNRQQKINFLFKQSVSRMLIVDEADHGAHQPGQTKALINARQDQDIVILMTGTNGDRAVGLWNIDYTISTVYPELVIEKRLNQKTYNTTLKHFKIDSQRHKLVVDAEFYQMNLANVVKYAQHAEPEAFIQDGVYLPSWSKFAAYPIKAKGFWTRMLQAIFLGQHSWDELNIDLQTNDVPEQRVAMMFLSGSIRNENLKQSALLAQQALPGYSIIPIYGEEMSNKTAESKVKEAIEKAKKKDQHVLLLSAGMASRSFSIGEITELYLSYDSGDNGSTIQKISRALTPNQEGKVGRIISLSFDPNRDDKFDGLILLTALNYKRNYNKKSLKDALRDVLRTFDVFNCAPEGALKLETDMYLEQAIRSNSLSRIAGKSCDLSNLTIEAITAIANGNVEAYQKAKLEKTVSGKTKLTNNKKNSKANSIDLSTEKLFARAREVIVGIIENLDVLVDGTGTKNLADAFDVISQDDDSKFIISREFGLEFDFIQSLIEDNVINQDLIELRVDH